MTHMRHRHFGSSMNKNDRLKFISPAKTFYTGRTYYFFTSSPDATTLEGLLVEKSKPGQAKQGREFFERKKLSRMHSSHAVAMGVR